jgi:hypothetical protein
MKAVCINIVGQLGQVLKSLHMFILSFHVRRGGVRTGLTNSRTAISVPNGAFHFRSLADDSERQFFVSASWNAPVACEKTQLARRSSDQGQQGIFWVTAWRNAGPAQKQDSPDSKADITSSD